MTNEERLADALRDMQLHWVRFYRTLPDGEYEGLGEMRQASIHAGKALIGEDYGEPDHSNMQAGAPVGGDGKQQEARELRQLLIDALHIIQAEVPEQGRRGWANTLAKIRSVLEYPAKDEPIHASGEPGQPSRAMVEETETDCRCGNYGRETVISLIQEARQAMAEKAAEIVNEELGDWGGPERKILDERLVTIVKRLRSLAGAEPGPVNDDELSLRREIWLMHGHQGLYGDDGEMQCGECHLDYKRVPVPAIIECIQALGLRRLRAVEPPQDKLAAPQIIAEMYKRFGNRLSPQAIDDFSRWIVAAREPGPSERSEDKETK